MYWKWHSLLEATTAKQFYNNFLISVFPNNFLIFREVAYGLLFNWLKSFNTNREMKIIFKNNKLKSLSSYWVAIILLLLHSIAQLDKMQKTSVVADLPVCGNNFILFQTECITNLSPPVTPSFKSLCSRTACNTDFHFKALSHSLPQRLWSFWSAPRIETSGQSQFLSMRRKFFL